MNTTVPSITIAPNSIPLSLYVHFPWCVQKCPYCDFNSHSLKETLPEKLYINALIKDWDEQCSKRDKPIIRSIFMGGGTPSLISPQGIARLLDHLQKTATLVKDIEITLEANPGTVDYPSFAGFRQAGVNRLSLGIQSFDDEALKCLGRIHSSQHAKDAINYGVQAGFENFNLDLMYALPKQNADDAVNDLQQAIAFKPQHLSWYQLTLEPNTVFYKHPPRLPEDPTIASIETSGYEILKQAGFKRYEVSAFAQSDNLCRHYLNYWQFGDYIGIGAGAHGKLSCLNQIMRTTKLKQPQTYLKNPTHTDIQNIQSSDAMIFEFMLNVLRLYQPITFDLFEQRVGLHRDTIEKSLADLSDAGYLHIEAQAFQPTKRGYELINDVVASFLH